MKTENLYTPDCIRTFTGLYVNVFNPTPEMICIEDIAHSLSQQCRFSGHLPEFYSVAQHSLSCSKMLENEDKLSGLMHDASEAYLLDIPSPIKKHLPEYKKLEDNMMKVIAKKFGFDYPLSDSVKHVDKIILEVEWQLLMLPSAGDSILKCLPPATAKLKFIEQFNFLTKTKK